MTDLHISLIEAVSDIDVADWDRLAGRHPFSSHAFLSAVEDSGSATAATGWRPLHIVAHAPDGQLRGILPGYLKAHSQGEYVFDHGWAEAWMRAGQAYYPKLQHAIPFTPATSPRLLAPDASVRRALVAASQRIVEQNQLSGAHVTFLNEADAAEFAEAGWMQRDDIQYHWENSGNWQGFDDFLQSLSSRKRKNLRKERAAALAEVDEVVWLNGSDLTESAWDAFWEFYQDTGARKWGRPYLTREFFSLIGAHMADRIMLVMAQADGEYIAGALNFIGEDCLYGRQWGATRHVPFLHFELCYHQAIDIACHHGLRRVEAGAQGPHKLARGYGPTITRSMHFIADAGFREAVADYLQRERAAIGHEALAEARYLPFRQSEE